MIEWQLEELVHIQVGSSIKVQHFGPISSQNLSPSGDLIEAAANLFSMMSSLDQSGCQSIAVEPIPSTGIGIAINDRLARAAAPRGDQNG